MVLIKCEPTTVENFDERVNLLNRLEDKHKENYGKNKDDSYALLTSSTLLALVVAEKLSMLRLGQRWQ